jgi:hypothetical protein
MDVLDLSLPIAAFSSEEVTFICVELAHIFFAFGSRISPAALIGTTHKDTERFAKHFML